MQGLPHGSPVVEGSASGVAPLRCAWVVVVDQPWGDAGWRWGQMIDLRLRLGHACPHSLGTAAQ